MSLYIPAWTIVALLIFAPFLIAWVTDVLVDHGGGMFDFSPLFTLGAFAVSAGVCWTGLILWAVMR